MQLISKNLAILSVFFTKNNILCTLSDFKGKTLFSISAGSNKTKGLKKITNTTLFVLMKKLNYQIGELQITSLYLRFRGLNKNKNDFFKFLKNMKFNILLVQNQNKIPHGGCRVPKPRKI